MTLKPVTEEFINELKSGLSPGVVSAVPDNYLSEPRSRWRGISSILVSPQTVKEVSAIVSSANTKNMCQGDHCMFVIWNIDPGDTRHLLSPHLLSGT